MNWDEKTVDTYDSSATELAEYFRGIGSRITDIEQALKLAKAGEKARIVEIGCGDGRDAAEIIKRVNWYQGFDPSKELLKLAKQKVTNESLVLAVALSYDYPENIDIIFAFASLLHVNKADIKKVFEKLEGSLRVGGILYISLKERDRYTEEVKRDKFGDRMFYYYNVNEICKLAGKSFKAVYEDHQQIGQTAWFTLALEKL